MSLITAENLGLYYGERAIFENFSFQVARKDRIGLVGRNGTGKTTLMRLIVGQMEPHNGSLRVTRGVRLGYLPQDVTDAPEGTLLSSVLSSVPGKQAVEDDIKKVEDALASSTDPEELSDLADELSDLLETQEHFDTVYAAHKAEEILTGLGFPTARFNEPLAHLSGGWRTRSALAALLYQRPDVLIMDEPTNHLDVDSVRWLSQYLLAYDQALLLVCHDREFLNRQITRIISFEPEGMRQYRGDYESYVTQRAEEEKILERRAKNQEQKARDAMKFVEKFRFKATKARQAQSKLKLLQKMEIIEKFQPQRTIRFSFPKTAPSGRVVFRLDNIGMAFGDNPLYKNVNLHINRGDRVAIIGPNGAGKTTLMKIMAGELAPESGSVTPGHGVTLSYYAQHQAEHLDPKRTVVEEVGTAAPDAVQSVIRGILGAFLFSGDEVDKTTGVLSGGEKARVALAKLLVRPGNCLFMDEPTNHLDIFASEKLIEALTNYDGTLVFVSHNQAFVNRLVTKVWDIKDGGVTEYPGTLNEYYDHLARNDAGPEPLSKKERKALPQGPPAVKERNAGPTGPSSKKGQVPQAAPAAKEKADNQAVLKGAPEPVSLVRADEKAKKRAEAEERQRLSKVLAPVRARIQSAEREIAELEERERAITDKLADPDVFSDPERGKALMCEYEAVRKDIARLLARWEKDNSQMEELAETGAA